MKMLLDSKPGRLHLPLESFDRTESKAVSLHLASQIVGALFTQFFKSSKPVYPWASRTAQNCSALFMTSWNLSTSFSAGGIAESSHTFTIRVVTSPIITEHRISKRSAGSLWARKEKTSERSANNSSALVLASPERDRVFLGGDISTD